MTIAGLHQRFKDRIGVSNGYEDLLPYEIDLKINEAQNWLIFQYGNKDQELSLVKNLLAPFFKPLPVKFTEVE